jgi:hypothetical protein
VGECKTDASGLGHDQWEAFESGYEIWDIIKYGKFLE